MYLLNFQDELFLNLALKVLIDISNKSWLFNHLYNVCKQILIHSKLNSRQ